MFKPCPNCGFLVALIAGREASQRCPRCGSGLVDEEELATLPADPPLRRDPQPHAVPASAPPATVGASPADGTPARMDAAPSLRASDARGAPVDTPETDPAAAATPRDEGGRFDATGSAQYPAAQPDSADVDTPPQDFPSFASRRGARHPAHRGQRWPWAVALPALALLLALQLVLAQRVELAQDARWRPVVSATCSVLGCEVPPWRAPAQLEMTSRDVSPDPARPGVLRVSTTLRNDAPWAQPLPTVMLSLSDVDGRVVGARAVPPAEYAPQPAALIPPGDSVDIRFEVREPSPRVVSFDFRLL